MSANLGGKGGAEMHSGQVEATTSAQSEQRQGNVNATGYARSKYPGRWRRKDTFDRQTSATSQKGRAAQDNHRWAEMREDALLLCTVPSVRTRICVIRSTHFVRRKIK